MKFRQLIKCLPGSKVQHQRDFPILEICERRLVLSAQLLFDTIPTLEQHLEIQSLACTSEEPSILIPEVVEAHQSTGWDVMQQRFGLTGKGQTVAVIDSGIAFDHVALGQGFGPAYRVVGGWDFAENDARPYDDAPAGFHGTHVAGIIGSSDSLHSGVAPDVDLVALRVFDDAGSGSMSWVEDALSWVHNHRDSFENPITTVNLSLGSKWNADNVPSWATLEDELRQLNEDGIVVVASAGNSFQTYQTPGLSYPASSHYVLPVASLDDNGQLSSFSQRNDRILAAPGRDIISTVPDYLLGRDGVINDFSSASGTSMAAPYVAGASVLVREAMQMVGIDHIDLDSINSHLRQTAQTVYDTITGHNYLKLDLDQAIDQLLPDDNVSDSLGKGMNFDLQASSLTSWLNTLADRDVYSFRAAESGQVAFHTHSEWIDSLNLEVRSSTGQLLSSNLTSNSPLNLVAGEQYQLVVSASHEIGPYDLTWDFQSQHAEIVDLNPAVELGRHRYLESQPAAGAHLRYQADQDGVFTVQWTDPQAPAGNLSILNSTNQQFSDSIWSDNTLRLDVSVHAGEWLDIQLPGESTHVGNLVVANLLNRQAGELHVIGTVDRDIMKIDLSHGIEFQIGQIEYAFSTNEITQLHIDGQGNNDAIEIMGSSFSDKVELRPNGSSLDNAQLSLQIDSTEQVTYHSGGGPDRVYLYDSDNDDTLTSRPGFAHLVGVGYEFEVDGTNRIFVHATGAGEDTAYLYDSSGQDRLSMRPQFTSLTGDDFFNYVRGFERVYAYANEGGVDSALLYDSGGDDRFSTNGASASLTGPGFSSFTRGFDIVKAISESGGMDRATLYGKSGQVQWTTGSDFMAFQDSDWGREARGFTSTEVFEDGKLVALQRESLDVNTNQEATRLDNHSDSIASKPDKSFARTDLQVVPLYQNLPPNVASDPMAEKFQAVELVVPEFGPMVASTVGASTVGAISSDATLPEAEPRELMEVISTNSIDSDSSNVHLTTSDVLSLEDWGLARATWKSEAASELISPDHDRKILDTIFTEHGTDWSP
ncbi:MAG: S8 family serine peptidase [Planctomycetales bacterium]|nr:S8 family serine peptidase [Planctomycetales bacterium]